MVCLGFRDKGLGSRGIPQWQLDVIDEKNPAAANSGIVVVYRAWVLGIIFPIK